MLTGLNLNRALLFKGSVLAESLDRSVFYAKKYLDSSQVPSSLSIEDGDKAESESIVNQSILIDNYMKSTSDITIVETFKDDGFSGTDFKRPGFQAMLKAIENKEINCIIVKDLSRFGREHIDVDRYIQKVFPQLGVRFIAINDNYDSETANITDTHLVLPVKSFVNDTYCRQNSQKVRSHLVAKEILENIWEITCHMDIKSVMLIKVR